MNLDGKFHVPDTLITKVLDLYHDSPKQEGMTASGEHTTK